MTSKYTVGMIGLGYVGLSTAAYLVSRRVRVVGLDVDRGRVASLSAGAVPIEEEGVGPLIRSALANGLISFHSDYEAVDDCDVVFIAVGTPSMTNGDIDTRFVEAAAFALGKHLEKMKEYPVVVVKSTVTPSTTRTKVLSILEKQSGLKCGRGFGLVVNPEFLREGRALWDMLHPDAIVIGKVDRRSAVILESLYRSVYEKMPPLIITNAVNAEFLKYGVNSLRAVQLSFINTLANMCSRTKGAEIDEVVRGLRLISHIDKRYSRAGMGYGGSCLPKDTNALISYARSLGVNDSLLSAAVMVNEGQAREAIALAESLIGPIKGNKIAVLGLTFKAGTDDTRESVGIRLANMLVSMGAKVCAYDPGYKPDRDHTERFRLARSVRDCLKAVDCCIVTNEWDEFKELTPQTFRKLMTRPVVVDGRGVYDIKQFTDAKVNVRRIGVGATTG